MFLNETVHELCGAVRGMAGVGGRWEFGPRCRVLKSFKTRIGTPSKTELPLNYYDRSSVPRECKDGTVREKKLVGRWVRGSSIFPVTSIKLLCTSQEASRGLSIIISCC